MTIQTLLLYWNRGVIMKGKSKIELFEQGLLVNEQVDHNLVTNFLDFLINMVFFPITRNNFNRYMFPTSVDYLKEGLVFPFVNGLAIFEDPLVLDATKYRIPTDNALVAFAAGKRTSTNPMSGIINMTESVFDPVAKTQKLVFDFATDRGNGTFESLGLMPGRGARALDLVNTAYGEVGALTLDFDEGSSVYHDEQDSLLGMIIGLIGDIIYCNSDITLNEGLRTIYRFNTYYMDYEPFDLFAYKDYEGTDEQLTDLTYTIPAGYKGDLKIVGGKIYMLEYEIASPYDVVIKELSPTDLSVLSTVTVNPPNNAYSTWYNSYNGIIGNTLFLTISGRDTYYMFDMTTGSAIGTVVAASHGTAYWDEFIQYTEDGTLGMIGTDVANRYLLMDSAGKVSSIFVAYPLFYGGKNIAIPKGPTLAYIYNGTKPELSLMPTALITQNNLASPVTKTSAQTMKITYTLSW